MVHRTKISNHLKNSVLNLIFIRLAHHSQYCLMLFKDLLKLQITEIMTEMQKNLFHQTA